MEGWATTVYGVQGIELMVETRVAEDLAFDTFVGLLGARLVLYASPGAWVRLSVDGDAVEVGRKGQEQLCLGFRRAYAVDRPAEAARVTVERLVDLTAIEPQFRVYIPPGEDV